MSSDGLAMADKAGAALTMMEKNRDHEPGTGFKHNWYGGAGDASYENVRLVDAERKGAAGPISKAGKKSRKARH